ncbi:MAG: M20/M25/M40 family metallo-hydrolase [Balneolaceae bacterium]
MKIIFTHLLVTFLLVSAGLSTSQCSKGSKISEENVSRIIKTLSSDEMKGRSAFSPEAAHAADFISNEFQQAGLEPFSNLEDYHQDFTIYSISPRTTSITINQKEIDEGDYFSRLYSRKVNWENSDVEIFRISVDDDFRAKQRQYSNNGSSSVILVDESHKDWFHRYRMYFSRPTRAFELDSSENNVFILYSDSVTSLEINIENSVETIELFNVVGQIEGNRPNEVVIFSAHYDHIGVRSPVDGDSIANGANDNASGVAAVIELARHFEALPKPERTLLFVGFTAEEAGGYGSKYFSELLDPENIIAMFNIEMIGKPAVSGVNSAWITGFEFSTFGEILQNSVKDSSFVFYPDPYPNQNLFYRSDNATLARLGVPAHSISTTPIDMDEDYHSVNDEFATINISHATNTIFAIAKAAEEIISGKETPTRIDPEEVK